MKEIKTLFNFIISIKVFLFLSNSLSTFILLRTFGNIYIYIYMRNLSLANNPSYNRNGGAHFFYKCVFYGILITPHALTTFGSFWKIFCD